jgi:hypothetical protein
MNLLITPRYSDGAAGGAAKPPCQNPLPTRPNTLVGATTSDTADAARPHERLAYGRH